MKTRFSSPARAAVLPLLLLLLVFGSRTAGAQDAAVAAKADEKAGTDKKADEKAGADKKADEKAGADKKADEKAGADKKADADEIYTPTNKTDDYEPKELTETEKAERARVTEGWLMTGVFAVGTGLQGGDPGPGTVAWSRARTRVLAGVDLRTDEMMSSGLGVYGFAELERRATLGAELRYQSWWTPTIAFHAAAVGVLTPESMIGPGVGARFGFPIGRRLTLFLEPGFTAFVIGNDLPNRNVVLWGTLIGGVGFAL